MSDLKKTQFEMVQDDIEKIHYKHRYDAGAMFGTLSANEAIIEYEDLLSRVDSIPGLTQEERQTLCSQIKERIANANQVEIEKEVEYQQYEVKKKEAFNKAKQRYQALGLLKRLKLALNKQNPAHVNYDWATVEELDNLYKKSR